MHKAPAHKARKRFGQHFLSDQTIIKQIINIINPQKHDHIIEIGPGKGALTIPIIKSIDKLNVIEIDKDLVNFLKKTIDSELLVIHENDALKFNYSKLNHSDLRIIGNLPYNISTPLLFHLLSYKNLIKEMFFMLQKEVVERICAKCGTKQYGRLSVTLQYYCDVESLLVIKPDAFNPSPKIDSAIMSFSRKNIFSKELIQSVNIMFSFRRKKLQNIGKKLGIEIESNQRLEEMNNNEIIKFAKKIRKI